MRHDDWRDREAARLRRHELEDYGQADYSDLYRYDPRTRSGYRAYDDGRRSSYPGDERPYFADRGNRPDVRYTHDDRSARWREDGRRRDGRPSDRVLWAIIMERLDDERRLDLRDVEVDVFDGEVTLDGFVRHKADKRRIEDVADIDGVRHVQNNLRVRERDRRWTFL